MNKTYYMLLFLLACFCLPIHAQGGADGWMEQAQSKLDKKEYTTARALYMKAYRAFATEGNCEQAIKCGTKATFLYYRENYYQEAFDLCRQMTQCIMTEEQKAQKTFYDLRFLVTKERLQMYIQLKNAAQAQAQLDNLDNLAKQAGNRQLTDELLYIQSSYCYTFGQNEQGDAYFGQLVDQYREKKEYDKVSECYKNLIAIARKTGNAALMERTYDTYMVWTDSAKALTAHDKLSELQKEYTKSKQTIAEKEDQLSGKQYLIVALCTFAVILIAGLLLLVILLLRFLVSNKKLKQIIQTTNEHNEQQAKFIRNISDQMEPTLQQLAASATELGATSPKLVEPLQQRIGALMQFGVHVQELSLLECALQEPYEVQPFQVGSFCQKMMEQVKDKVSPGVETLVDAPSLEVNTNAEQLEHILLHLLINAALNTQSGKIVLEFKRKGAHLCHFVVTDSGSGLSAEQKEHLFKPFAQTKDLAEGDGLGLPIASLIAARLNGSLSVDMEYNKGCRFVLVLKV